MERSIGSSGGCQALHADEGQREVLAAGQEKGVVGYATGDSSPSAVRRELSGGLDDPTNVPATPNPDVDELGVAGE